MSLKVGVLIVLAWYAVVTRDQVHVWRSDLTLWEYAYQTSPTKPRVALNYGLALMLAGHQVGAAELYTRASRLAALPHVPAWDRHDVFGAVAANRRTLAAMQALAGGS